MVKLSFLIMEISYVNKSYGSTFMNFNTSMNGRRDGFNFHITKFFFMSSSIPSTPAYGVLILKVYGTPGLVQI